MWMPRSPPAVRIPHFRKPRTPAGRCVAPPGRTNLRERRPGPPTTPHPPAGTAVGRASHHPPGLLPPGNQPCDLRPAQSRDLGQEPPNRSFGSLLQPSIRLGAQHPFDEGIPAAIRRDDPQAAVALHKFLHFNQREPFQILHSECHSPAASDIRLCFSGSPRIGNEIPVQAHSALDNSTSSGAAARCTIVGHLHAGATRLPQARRQGLGSR